MTFSWGEFYYSLSFLWIVSFDWKELFRRSPISIDRIPNLPADLDADYLFKLFSRYWDREMSRPLRGNKPRLWVSLLRTFWKIFFILFGLTLFYLLLYFSLVLILIWLIRGLEDTLYTGWHLICIAVLFAVCSVILNFSSQTLDYGLSIVGMKYRALLTTAIFHKMQSMSYDQVQGISFGHILTIITTDLFKFDHVMSYVPSLFLTPSCILLIVIVASLEIGWPVVLILFLFVVHLLITLALAAVDSQMYKKALKYSDIRNKHIREFIEGIKLIKCFAWEYAVAATIQRIRKREIRMILGNFFFKSMGYTVSLVFPTLYIFMVCLIIYISVLKGELTPSRVFGLAAFMHWYYQIYKQFNTAIVGISELMVGIDRVQKLLQQQTRNSLKAQPKISSQTTLKVTGLSSGRNNGNSIIVPVINQVTFSLQKGSIMSVIGSVGSGKTSLFLSLVNELVISGGEVHLPGSCVFVPQEPWILSTSVRENITYGKTWDSDWYEQVITACCLLVDFDQLSERDLTIVGERGITLSGGQKARIGFARAVYANTDIYLLDDPLSSVDVAVAKRLFDIFTHGLLASKTVILATNQLQFVKRTDQVLILDKGQVLACGAYQDIEELPLFRQYYKQIQTHYQKEDDVALETENMEEGSLDLRTSELITSPVEPKNIINEEVVHYTSISILTYAKYFWAGSNVFGIVILAFFGSLSYFGVFVLLDYYLALWIMASQSTQNNITRLMNATVTFNPLTSLTLDMQIVIFISFCIGLSILLFVSGPLETCLPVLSSFRLHTRMVWRVLRAPSTFFYTHSSGSIINRFSRDISTMDYLLPHYFHRFFLYLNILLLTMVSAAITHWLTLVPSICLLIILILYRFHLVGIIRQIKRLESAAKSDIILHTSLTLHGLTSIHSLELESHQFRKLCTYENIHSKCWRMYIGFIRWFGFQVNCIIAVYSLSVALVLILLRDQLSPAISAFALSQLFRLFDTSQFLLRVSAEVEMNMVSVERVFDYLNLPQEPPLHNTAKSAENNLITTGEIEFYQVHLRYSQNLPLVLKGVSFKVVGGEKLGIVGRTGAGKSSLQTALLRLVELDSGYITIDGMDINKFGLHELRGQISIIPQDPILFSGTLRFALDPFSVFEDNNLWLALEEVHLKRKVESLEGQLDHSVAEGGSNFSVGERQLFCLARALLKQTKLLILDEATSNVDSLTDHKIQQILHSKFQNCTILTIAHRLHTVLNYDRILLMDNGRIIECDSPNNLLANPCSRFSQLMSKTKMD